MNLSMAVTVSSAYAGARTRRGPGSAGPASLPNTVNRRCVQGC